MERNEPPRWIQDKHFNEVLFCEDFLSAHPMVCVDGSFFTVEGRVTDEEGIRKQIYEMLRPHFTSGTARRATGLLETLRLEAYTPELPIQEDRIHVANGTLFLSGAFCTEKEFCRNRLPVNYDPSAPQPETWLRFLSDLLEAEDILTLQEYLGYCLIPTNRGQVMMLLKGNGGEGKSRIGVVMQKLLGSNLKNGSIAKVERSPFARADLEHELLMVDDDMKLEALQSTHYYAKQRSRFSETQTRFAVFITKKQEVFMSIRNEIKSQIVRAGFTMQEIVDRLAEEYDWSDSVSNLSAKLQRESIRYKEVVELADVLDCDIVWVKRGERR